MAPSQSHNSTHKRISCSHGKMNQIRGKGSKQGLPIDQGLLLALHTSATPQIYPPHTDKRCVFISGFNYGWGASSSFTFCARCTLSASRTTPLDVPVIIAASELTAVSGAFWEFFARSPSRSTFSCQSRAAQMRPADTLSWGCSFTAVLTEATICRAGRGRVLRVKPLQSVSAFSSCRGASDGRKKKRPL